MIYRVLKKCNYRDVQFVPGQEFAAGDLADEMVNPLVKSKSVELVDETKPEPDQKLKPSPLPVPAENK